MCFIYNWDMLKLPPLVELRAFEAAARHMSFKKAAAELCVTPTAISHQIRLLERYCGRSLFRRRPRPLALTEAGASLFPAVRDGLEAFATAITTVKRDGRKQPLRTGRASGCGKAGVRMLKSLRLRADDGRGKL